MDVRNFQEEVIEESRRQPVVVDFWAPWCGPCRILGPVLEKLAAEGQGKWKLAKLNTDENPTIAARYQISGIPAVKLFMDGEVAGEFVGALPEARVRAWLDELLPSESKERLEEAAAALEEGDDARAKAILDDVLSVEPDNADARLLLARALIFDEPQRAADLARAASASRPALYQKAQAVETIVGMLEQAASPERLPEGPGREAYAEALRALASSDIDLAVSKLVEVIRRDRRYNDDAARRGCIAIFNLLGDGHPVTRAHQRAFEMAVF